MSTKQAQYTLELLDALGWIVEFCQERPEWFGTGTADEGAEYEWLEHAEALIAKAPAS